MPLRRLPMVAVISILVNESLVKCICFRLVDRRAIPLQGFSNDVREVTASGVSVFTMEAGGYKVRMYAYVVPGLAHYVFSGSPWFICNRVVHGAAQEPLRRGRGNVRI